MIEAVAVQVERAGAAARPSPLLPPHAQAPDRERGGLLRESARAATPEAGARPVSGRVPPAGLIDKDGLLKAQEEETEEERQRRQDPQNLTEEERAIVKELQARDREVRAHEQAHARVGGQYAGSPRYTYETGPDGRRYAVGGSVSIDVSPVRGDPEETIRKMEQVKKAALAPAEPSAQDRAVAAKADAVKAQARAELAQKRAAEQREAREKEEEEQKAQEAARASGSESDAQGLLAALLEGIGSEEAGLGDGSSADRSRIGRALQAYGGGAAGGLTGFTGAADATQVLSLLA